MTPIERKILDRLNPSARIVVLTGAGVSAESNIPTFRDPQEGLWSRYQASDLATPEAFSENPKLVYDWYRWRRSMVVRTSPNLAHSILGRWEKYFENFTLITQNVDGLHHRAGSADSIEMHGSIHKMRCTGSTLHFSSWVDVEQGIPECSICGTYLRPDIVWFGESIAETKLVRIHRSLRSCDVFLSVGTSGVVYPAAGFLSEARRNGALTISVNPDPEARGAAEYFLQGKATVVLKDIDDAIFGLTARG